ncbi:MAG: AAA family ATPase [Deltaproteobacteria bacterium]|nr:AAA family ATPase [Deltaproteobacteria bacterium]
MRVIAIVNQKGGCGKTTTTVNLAGALAEEGHRVLVVDMDPQAHATLALGLEPDDLEANLYEVLVEPTGAGRLDSIIIDVSESIDIAPSSIVLSALEQKLASERHDARTERLSAAIEALPPLYDFVLIDCPPNVGLLTFNALRAAGEVIIPLETSFFAIDGVQKLLETIGLLSERIGHKLHVRVLPTLYDGRTRYARNTLGEIRELFKELCFDSVIRLNVKLREAAKHGVPISRFAPTAIGALDYASVAMELAAAPPEVLATIPTERRGAPDAIGAPREVVVRFKDAAAGDVRIAGDFNGWVPDRGVRSLIASEGQTRVWTKVLTLEPGTYQYRYVVDGEWREDPANPQSAPGPTGQPNSILHVR